MQCTIAGNNIKFLGRSIYSLSRIGEDVYIETRDNELLLQTVNSSRSAYACFTFQSPFFCELLKTTDVKCKVTLKSWLIAFRSLSALEKTAEKCLIDTASEPDTLVIEFSCMKALKKVYHLPFIENETVQAEFPNNAYQCKFTAQSRLLTDGIQNFCLTVEEVTLQVSFDQLTFKNYVEDEPDPSKIVHTELTLESDEFDEYEVQQETEVTFCLKELRALLSFLEGSNVPVTICCEGAGKPVIFTVQSTTGMKSEFVLATLADTGSSQISGISIEKNSVPMASKTHDTKKVGSKRKLESKTESYKVQVVSNGSLSEVPVQDPETSSAVCATVNKATECANRGATVKFKLCLPKGGSNNVSKANDVGEKSVEANDVGEKSDDDDNFVPSTPPRDKKSFGWSQKTLCWPLGDGDDNDDEILVPCSDSDSD